LPNAVSFHGVQGIRWNLESIPSNLEQSAMGGTQAFGVTIFFNIRDLKNFAQKWPPVLRMDAGFAHRNAIKQDAPKRHDLEYSDAFKRFIEGYTRSLFMHQLSKIRMKPSFGSMP
jgi:hypothetical protein